MIDEPLFEKVKRWAEMADTLAKDLQPLTKHVPGETWVLANGLADELAEFEKDIRSELMAAKGQ